MCDYEFIFCFVFLFSFLVNDSYHLLFMSLLFWFWPRNFRFGNHEDDDDENSDGGDDNFEMAQLNVKDFVWANSFGIVLFSCAAFEQLELINWRIENPEFTGATSTWNHLNLILFECVETEVEYTLLTTNNCACIAIHLRFSLIRAKKFSKRPRTIQDVFNCAGTNLNFFNALKKIFFQIHFFNWSNSKRKHTKNSV